MRWTWSSITGTIFVFAAVLFILFSSHKEFGIYLNLIGVAFLFTYTRKYGKRVNSPYDHEGLRLF